VYLHRLASSVLAMTASLGGLDALVFTGGVGERAPVVRAGAAARLAHLGVAVDGRRNDAAVIAGPQDPDHDITADGATVATLVVLARESLQIAAGVARALATRP
jgi:acetate kinase